MIGLHINNLNVSYSDKHLNISRSYGDLNVCVSFHSEKQKQVFFEDDDFAVFIDGWIFNSVSYSQQAEFVLQQYRIHHAALPNFLDGQFNICIVNKQTSDFEFFADIFSFRKHYYSMRDNKVYISSDIEYLAENVVNREINRTHLVKHLKMPRFIDVKETFYKNINQISPCTVVEQSGIDIKLRYYDISIIEKKFLSELPSPEDYKSFFVNNARYVHKSTPVLLELSGGLDSRFVLEILNNCELDINTITYGIKGSDEVDIAADVAEANKTNHFEINLDHKDFLKKGFKYIAKIGGMDLFVQSCIDSVLNQVKPDLSEAVIDTGLYLDYLIGDTYSKKVSFKEKDHVIGQDSFDFTEETQKEFFLNNRCFSSLAVRLTPHREYFDDRYSMYSYASYFLLKNLPLEIRENYKLYYEWSQMVINNSFEIPLHNTMYGLDLDVSLWDEAKKAQIEKENLSLKQFQKFNTPIYHNRYYSDFDMWLRSIDEWKKQASDLLLSEDTRLNEFVDKNEIQLAFDEHMSANQSRHSDLIKWMSVEMFLRQSIF